MKSIIAALAASLVLASPALADCVDCGIYRLIPSDTPSPPLYVPTRIGVDAGTFLRQRASRLRADAEALDRVASILENVP